MSTKERLHALIEEMNEDQAEMLLMNLEDAEPIPLTAAERADIDKGRSELRAGLGIPHEEVLKRLGIAG